MGNLLKSDIFVFFVYWIFYSIYNIYTISKEDKKGGDPETER